MGKCECYNWKKNIKKLDNMQLFCSNQIAAPKWDGDIFEFCPWCGQKLKLQIMDIYPDRNITEIYENEKGE